MIERAKRAGADVAKFQLYDPRKLLKEEDFKPADWKAILDSELRENQVAVLKNTCDREGIEFMASAFDLERLGWLEEMGVKRHKIASRSIYDMEYVKAVQATGKPYFASFGMLDSYKEPIYDTWNRVVLEGDGQVLFCVPKYPTDLRELGGMPDKFGPSDKEGNQGFYGFSDHTIGLTAAKVAIARGARLIEKHFTSSKRLPGPDQSCSIEREELRALCKFRDEVYEMEG